MTLIKFWPGGALVVSLLGACTVSETDEAPSQTWQQSLASEDAFVDGRGRHWERQGKVTYSDMSYAEVRAEMAASARATLKANKPQGRTLADLDDMTDDEAAALLRPRMEFQNTEFLMAEEDVRDLVKTLRELKRERKARKAQGLDTGDPGGSGVSDESDADVGFTSEALIYNGDQRSNNNYRADENPFRKIGQGGTNSDRWCTCFKMINQYTCLTNGHCHWYKGAWQKRRPITFKAGSSAPLKQIPADCYARATYYSGGDDHDNDVAVIALRGVGGAWCDPDSYSVGWLGWSEPPLMSKFTAWTAGYPADGMPSGWSYPTQSWQSSSNNYAWAPWNVTHTFDTTGGQSGSPIVSNFDDGTYRTRAVHWGAADSNGPNCAVGVMSEWVDALSEYAGY